MRQKEQHICLLDQSTVRLIAKFDTEVRVGQNPILPLDRALLNEHHRSRIYHQLSGLSAEGRISLGERHPSFSGLSIGLNSRKLFEIYGSPKVNLKSRIDALLLVTEPIGFKAILQSMGTPDYLRHNLINLEQVQELATVANRLHPEFNQLLQPESAVPRLPQPLPSQSSPLQ